MKKILIVILSLFLVNPCYAAHNFSVLTSRTVIENTSTYDGFGDLEKIGSDTILHAFRSGEGHGTGTASIVGKKYTISTGTWGTTYTILPVESGRHFADIEMGIIGNRIFLFYKRETSAGTTLSMEYIVSRDLTGTSWSSPTVLTPHAAFDSFLTHQGAFTETDTPGTYILLVYHLTGSTRSIRVFKTTNYGNTWADTGTPVVSGSTQWGEPSVCHIGDGKMVGIVRRNDGGYMGYFTSDDNGDTWSSVSDASFFPNSTSIKPGFIYYDKQYDDVFFTYLSRGGTTEDIIYYSVAIDPQAVYDDFNTAFASPLTLTSDNFNNSFNGYPSAIRIGNYKYLVVWSEEVGATDADMYYGIIRNGDEGMTFR